MSRCSKCNGCTSLFNEYRPNWCKDSDCPEGGENPDKRNGIEILMDLQKEWLTSQDKTNN